mgnify:CR=1 FL=1
MKKVSEKLEKVLKYCNDIKKGKKIYKKRNTRNVC